VYIVQIAKKIPPIFGTLKFYSLFCVFIETAGNHTKCMQLAYCRKSGDGVGRSFKVYEQTQTDILQLHFGYPKTF
jgi:hypothetical protein